MPGEVTSRSIFITAQDGLRLHVREYGSRTSPGLSVVCLPGLTRTVADFDTLAAALAADSTGSPSHRDRLARTRAIRVRQQSREL